MSDNIDILIESTYMCLAEVGITNVEITPAPSRKNPGRLVMMFDGAFPDQREQIKKASLLARLRVNGPDDRIACMNCHLCGWSGRCPDHPVGWMLATGGGCEL